VGGHARPFQLPCCSARCQQRKLSTAYCCESRRYNDVASRQS
jgi:hypothetical protein